EGQQFTRMYRGREFPGLWLASHGFADLTPLTLFQQTLEYRTPNVSAYESSEYADLIRRLEDFSPRSADALAAYKRLNDVMLNDAFVIPTGIPQLRIDLVGPRV